VSPEIFLRKAATRLRKARWRLGLTQEEAAIRARVTARYYAEIERGRKSPTVLTLFEIAQAMKIAMADLVDVGDAPRVALDELDLQPPARGRKPKARRAPRRP
jgi:transcriptional regulator with XRE-family HTH domain